jgi:hypothetical protein
MASVTRRVVSAVTLGVALAGATAAPGLATAQAATGDGLPLNISGQPAQTVAKAGDLLGPAVSLLDPAKLSQLGTNLSTGVSRHEMDLMQNMGTHMMQSMPSKH